MSSAGLGDSQQELISQHFFSGTDSEYAARKAGTSRDTRGRGHYMDPLMNVNLLGCCSTALPGGGQQAAHL